MATATATRKQKRAAKSQAVRSTAVQAKQSGKVIYDEVGIALKAGKDEALTADEAKLLIGYKTPGDGEDFGAEFVFRDLEKRKVKLTNNPTNRPFRMQLAKRYQSEILRKKWVLNGETIVIDRFGHVQSGQHRLVALIMAEMERLKHPTYWEEHYGWKGPVTADFLLVTGISEKKEVADTLDLGQKRSLGDVVFRRHEFPGVSDKAAKRMANMLSSAVRLVWIRTGGGMVAEAKHFPHSEALQFLENHPKIKDATQFIFDEEGGSGAEGKKISSLISLAYAAAFLYLCATCKSDPDKEKTDFSLWDKATEFWTLFGSGAGMESGNPILTLRNQLTKVTASGGQERDIVCGMVAKAWNAWLDGKDLVAKDIKIKETVVDSQKVLAEKPRVGGLDTDREPPVLTEVEGWSIGDTCWVLDAKAGTWEGTITAFQDRDLVEVRSKEDGDIYVPRITDIVGEKPDEPETSEGAEVAEEAKK